MSEQNASGHIGIWLRGTLNRNFRIVLRKCGLHVKSLILL